MTGLQEPYPSRNMGQIPDPIRGAELIHDPYVLAVPAGSELAPAGRPPSMPELARLPLICFRTSRSQQGIEAHLRAHGIDPSLSAEWSPQRAMPFAAEVLVAGQAILGAGAPTRHGNRAGWPVLAVPPATASKCLRSRASLVR